jgi:hypothetical protein
VGSSVLTNPGFTNTSPCPYPAIYPQTGCDNFSFINGVGPNTSKFTAFPVAVGTSSVTGQSFGSYSGYTIPTIQDTFLIAHYPPTDF